MQPAVSVTAPGTAVTTGAAGTQVTAPGTTVAVGGPPASPAAAAAATATAAATPAPAAAAPAATPRPASPSPATVTCVRPAWGKGKFFHPFLWGKKGHAYPCTATTYTTTTTTTTAAVPVYGECHCLQQRNVSEEVKQSEKKLDMW